MEIKSGDIIVRVKGNHPFDPLMHLDTIWSVVRITEIDTFILRNHSYDPACYCRPYYKRLNIWSMNDV